VTITRSFLILPKSSESTQVSGPSQEDKIKNSKHKNSLKKNKFFSRILNKNKAVLVKNFEIIK